MDHLCGAPERITCEMRGSCGRWWWDRSDMLFVARVQQLTEAVAVAKSQRPVCCSASRG